MERFLLVALLAGVMGLAACKREGKKEAAAPTTEPASTLPAANSSVPATIPASTEPLPPRTRKALIPRNDLPGLSNFAKVSDSLYRGAQPTAEGMRQLKAMGIKTVINLRALHSDRDEMAGTGLQYYHIHSNAWHPEDEDIVRFLRIVRDPANQPVFVHCLHGADRTGCAVAAYRITVEKWTPADAALELSDFGFHPVFGQITTYLKRFDGAAMERQVEGLESPTLEVVQ